MAQDPQASWVRRQKKADVPVFKNWKNEGVRGASWTLRPVVLALQRTEFTLPIQRPLFERCKPKLNSLVIKRFFLGSFPRSSPAPPLTTEPWGREPRGVLTTHFPSAVLEQVTYYLVPENLQRGRTPCRPTRFPGPAPSQPSPAPPKPPNASKK